MAHYEKQGGPVEYYTPKYIFDAMGVTFDLDVAAPEDLTHIHTPSYQYIKNDSLNKAWFGFVWMNPPYGNESNKLLWIKKFVAHGNGVALMPDRTSTTWWQFFAEKSDAFAFTRDKIKFHHPDGTLAKSPGIGNTFFAIGEQGIDALINLKKNNLADIYRKF